MKRVKTKIIQMLESALKAAKHSIWSKKTTPRCSESPPPPVNFPTVLIAGVSARHKNIQPVQIYLRSSPRAL